MVPPRFDSGPGQGTSGGETRAPILHHAPVALTSAGSWIRRRARPGTTIGLRSLRRSTSQGTWLADASDPNPEDRVSSGIVPGGAATVASESRSGDLTGIRTYARGRMASREASTPSGAG